MNKWIGAIGVTLVLLAAAGPGLAAERPSLALSDGAATGLSRGGVEIFYGLPYAAPPVGPLRLAPPVPAQPWTGTLRAVVPPAACPQLASPDPAGLASSNEDCLYLNVFRPAGDAGAAKRPVIVWLHGGGFVEGYGAAKQYDASRLALAAGAIVVSANYRVGALGFLAAQALDEADPRHVSGNYGLMDAQMALRWVQRSAAALGGDPANVTVMGESAGANAILGLLASPASAGLFARAIVQSATDGAHALPLARAERETYGRALAEIGCDGAADTVACLRGARVDAFLRVNTRFTMVADGSVLPLDPFDAITQGKALTVPVLIGSNAKENYLFTARVEADGLKRAVSPDDLPGLLQSSFGDKAGAVADHYRPESYAVPSLLIGSALTDRRFSCMADLARTGLAAHAPVYAYQLDIADPVQQQPLMPGVDLPNVSYHTTDLAYVFDNDADGNALTGRHAALSRTMMGYWAAFAAGGDPNPAGETPHVTWPRFSPDDGAVLTLADSPAVDRNFAEQHQCRFWRQEGLVAPTW